jgi:ribonuclease P protein component
LRRAADFRRAQGSGLRVRTAHFILVVVKRPDPGPSRLGLVVSRKVGNAVARNRVKRRVRELFRTWDGLLTAGVDLVLIAGPGSATLSLEEVRREWSGVQQMLAKKAQQALADPKEATHVDGRQAQQGLGPKKQG